MGQISESAGLKRVDLLAECVVQAANLLRTARSQGGDLSSARFGVLKAVESREMPSMNSVARAVGVAPRTLTELVDGLEGDGLIRRLPNPADRRGVLLELTGAGSVEVRASEMSRRARALHVFSSLTEGERQILIEILSKLISR